MKILTAMVNTANAANKLLDSAAGKGLKVLVADLSEIAIWACPAVCGLVAVIFVMRRGAAEEDIDKAKYWKNAKISVFCGVVGSLVGGLITVLSSYFAS